MRFFSRESLPAARQFPYIADLDAPLLQLSKHRDATFSLRDATAGVHITGGTGSGKTSGSGAALAQAYLKAGFGFLVLTAKPGEYEWFKKLARQAGREHQLIHFSPGSGLRFNFLDYAIAADREAGRGMATTNLVNLIMKVTEAAQRGNELRGQAAEQPFWRLAPQELLNHTIDALYAAYGTLRLPELVEFITSAPRGDEDLANAAFREASFHMRTLEKMARDPVHRLTDADADAVMGYFRFNFGRLDMRTRSNIVATMTSQLAPLLKGMMREIFTTETTIVPELTYTAGAIIVIDFPVKTYGDAGLLAQHIFKFLWQKSVESRDVKRYDRPVVLWGDEAQFFITPYDIHFQTTARSSRACTVYLTQSISNYYASIGGTNPRDATQAFLNNFMTKVFHANADHNTNQAASEMIGRSLQLRHSASNSSGGSTSQGFSESLGTSFQSGGGGSSSREQVSSNWSYSNGNNQSLSLSDSLSESWSRGRSVNQVMEYEIEPGVFARLRSGPENGWRTDAIWFQPGRRFKANRGRNYLALSFPIVRV